MREVGSMEKIGMKIEYIEMNRGKERVDTIESISRMINRPKTQNPKPKTHNRRPEVSHA